MFVAGGSRTDDSTGMLLLLSTHLDVVLHANLYTISFNPRSNPKRWIL